MSQSDEKKQTRPLLFDDHPRPLTRRGFLACGIAQLSAVALLPRWIERAISGPGAGMAIADTAVKDLPAFLVFDMAGGGALPGNFLVGRDEKLQDLLKSYSDLGWNPRLGGALDTTFGIPMAGNAGGTAPVSKILQGIKQTASPAAQALLRMGSFCHFAQFDSSVNQTSALALVAKAGYTGRQLPNGLGMQDSLSGGNTDAVESNVVFKPLTVNSVNNVIDALSFGPTLGALPTGATSALARAAQRLSEEQARRLQGMGQGSDLQRSAGGAYQRDIGYAGGASGLDPRVDPVFQNIYGIDDGSDATGVNVLTATIVMNALRRNTGPGAIVIGGCDYHTGSNTEGDAKDRETGQHIGRAVEAAYQLRQPLFFQLVTDGGCNADPNTRNWSGDSNEKTLTIIGYFNPSAPPKQLRLQVGRFTDGQGADMSHFIGSDPAKVAYAVLANYLQLSGRLGEFESHAPRSLFSTLELEQVLIFER